MCPEHESDLSMHGRGRRFVSAHPCGLPAGEAQLSLLQLQSGDDQLFSMENLRCCRSTFGAAKPLHGFENPRHLADWTEDLDGDVRDDQTRAFQERSITGYFI